MWARARDLIELGQRFDMDSRLSTCGRALHFTTPTARLTRTHLIAMAYGVRRLLHDKWDLFLANVNPDVPPPERSILQAGIRWRWPAVWVTAAAVLTEKRQRG